jgi:division/cell wall cluster transcriptional repressor MraZ
VGDQNQRANMSRFRGRYDFSIDQKGRINVPAKFRKLLSGAAKNTFVVCRAPDGCLWAYPLDAWERFEDSLMARPVNRDTNKFQRELQNTLTDSTLDQQGRRSGQPDVSRHTPATVTILMRSITRPCRRMVRQNLRGALFKTRRSEP